MQRQIRAKEICESLRISDNIRREKTIGINISVPNLLHVYIPALSSSCLDFLKWRLPLLILSRQFAVPSAYLKQATPIKRKINVNLKVVNCYNRYAYSSFNMGVERSKKVFNRNFNKICSQSRIFLEYFVFKYQLNIK